MQKDVAKEHRLKPLLVCRLVMKAKKNKNFLDELTGRRDAQLAEWHDIAEALEEMNKHNVVIDSVREV